jgi:CheY-like chemotaxis protein
MTGFDFEAVKVLVVDDSRSMRSLIKSFLIGFGVKEMFEANDANEGYYTVCLTSAPMEQISVIA